MLLFVLAACDSMLTLPKATTPIAEPQSILAEPQSDATPTPFLASDLLARAIERYAIGDFDAAAADFSSLLASHPDAPEARQARYYLAASYAQRGRWTSTVETLQSLVAESVEDELTAPALFLMALGYEAAGDWPNAVATYERYRALGAILEPYAAIRQAAQQRALGQLAEAAMNYEHGAHADIARGERAGSYEKAIALYQQLGQNDRALQLYTELLDFAEQPNYRARILAEAIALAQQLGREDQARIWLIELVSAAPATAQAGNAVDQLLAAGDPALAPAQAAQVYFNLERYTEALAQFDAAIAQANPGSDDALELQRLRGLTLRALGDFASALEALAAVSAASPNSQPGRQAQLDWVQTIGQSGDTLQAINGYRQYAATYGDDPRAPEALDRVAQLLDRLGDSENAMLARLELGQRYPQSDQASNGLNNAGFYFFHAGRLGEAKQAWRILAEHQTGYERARGAFWAARVAQQQQDQEQSSQLFENAYTAAPDSYYGARAAEELGMSAAPTLTLGDPISADNWRVLNDWIGSWANAAANAEQEPAPEVAASGFVQRATALEQVGLQAEAIAEWNNARTHWSGNPTQLAQLARLAHEQDVPYIALKAAEQIAGLAPETALPLPETLRRLILPAPYTNLVVAQSRDHGVDPRLLYALMRQESLFNPGATSWVGARGLAQVMPSTGEGIAQNLGVTDFTINDLYRPVVSVRFGAFYLGRRIADMEGSVHGALAAYNGGLGNSIRWAGGSSVADPDLFTEGIDYFETRGYVKLVYGYYGAYQRLYALP
ncbi:MAG: transglycosylase SLT domain-containing protein [Chloroflexales bacterium]|nr:transglycosylase SLT domain-containing protein [Chloroflexales bacterium]